MLLPSFRSGAASAMPRDLTTAAAQQRRTWGVNVRTRWPLGIPVVHIGSAQTVSTIRVEYASDRLDDGGNGLDLRVIGFGNGRELLQGLFHSRPAAALPRRARRALVPRLAGRLE